MTTKNHDTERATERRYHTTQEVAEILRMEKRTVENWRYLATPYGPPYVHISGAVRYPVTAFNAWCDEQDSKALNNSVEHRNSQA